jgi:putative Holliday junction resolvase
MASAIISIEALAQQLGSNQRLIGVDLGTVTIGLALSDVERRIASPFETIRRVKFTKDVERLKAVTDQYAVAALVIGLPLNMDGSEGPRVQSTRTFVRQMQPLIPLPVCLWDERLSTAAVTRSLIDQDVSRAKRAAVVDRMAAAYILQGVLDRLKHLSASPLP